MDWSSLYAQRMGRVRSSRTMDLIRDTAGRGFLPFASGLPDGELFPLEALRTLSLKVLEELRAAALQYSAAEGDPALRAYVAGMLREEGARGLGPDSILITHGSQQALDILCRLFLDPGDRVAVETPTYLALLQTARSFEVEFLPLPCDGQGLRVEAMEEALGGRPPKLLYLMPSFQNPTGRTLPEGRRRALAAWTGERGVIVVEDHAYAPLWYDRPPPPPLKAFAQEVILTGTFSKTVVPGLRVGYIAADPQVVARATPLKQMSDFHTSTFAQRLVLEFVRGPEYGPHVERLRARYREKRDAMLRELEEQLPEGFRWTRPGGGMFLWLEGPPDFDALRLARGALEEKLALSPGADFMPEGGGENALRVNFVGPAGEQIREGVRILARLVRESSAR